jgi:hypothetical protein
VHIPGYAKLSGYRWRARAQVYYVIHLHSQSLIWSLAQVWGAVDFAPAPDCNFPDWRNAATIDNNGTSIMLIPREDGLVRLYIELGSEEGYINPNTGRVDLTRFSAERLLSVGICVTLACYGI